MQPTRPSRSRALTLVEVSVTAGLLLLLFAAIVMIYHSSATVWRKVDHRTALLRELQVAVRYIERGLEITHPFGLAHAENRIAYLSALDEDDEIRLDGQGKLQWQRFVLLYLDPDGRLRRRFQPLSSPSADAPTFHQEFGVKLDSFPSGPRADDRYLTHAGRVTRLSLEPVGDYGSLYELWVEGEQPREGGQTEQLEIRTRVSLRN